MPDCLKSTAYPVDGRGRTGSGETQARPNATGKMTAKYALFPNLNEKTVQYCHHREVGGSQGNQ